MCSLRSRMSAMSADNNDLSFGCNGSESGPPAGDERWRLSRGGLCRNSDAMSCIPSINEYDDWNLGLSEVPD